MNILICHTNKEARDIISFCLESKIGGTINTASSFAEANKLIGKEKTTDIIIVNSEPNSVKLLEHLLANGLSTPVIMITETSDFEEMKNKHPQVFEFLPLALVPEKLIELIKKTFAQEIESRPPEEYCQIKADLLGRIGPLKGDIYIRLSDQKFVKLYKTGTVFSPESLQQLITSKKVRNLYIKNSDSADFIEKFKEDLHRMLDLTEPEFLLDEQVTSVHELIHELSHKIGFSSEVRTLASQAVKLTLKKIGACPQITRVLSKSHLRGSNYISYHSVILAEVSCSLAAQMKWPSETTFHKLTLAALFHDFTLQDPSLAKIADMKNLKELKELNGEGPYKEVLNHPLKCAEIVRGMKDVPGDVEFLVFNHHERPDGSGFPKGLRSYQIVGLSAIFIVAHDIVTAVLEQEDKFNLQNFLAEREHTYDAGAFKKIFVALTENAKKLAG